MFCKKLIVALLAGISLCTLTGCLSDNDDEVSDDCTVTATVTLYDSGDGSCYGIIDGGGVIRMTASSIQQTLGANGISGITRALICCKFKAKDREVLSSNEVIISNAELYAFMAIPIYPVYEPNVSEAIDEKIAAASKPDSIYQISKINSMYVYNEYLTVDFTASSNSKVMPALTIVCDSTKENDFYFRMLYNNHAASNTSTNKYLFSYRLISLSGLNFPQDSATFHFSGFIGGSKDYKFEFKVPKSEIIQVD